MTLRSLRKFLVILLTSSAVTYSAGAAPGNQSTTSAPKAPLTSPMSSLISTPISAPKTKKKKMRARSRLTEADIFKRGIEAAGASRFHEAIRIFQSLTELRPTKGLYWFNLGNALFLSGEPIRSIAAYQKVIDLKSPLAPAAWLYYAKAQREAKSWDDAIEAILVLRPMQLPPNMARELNEEIAALQSEMSERALDAYRANRFELCLKLIDSSNLMGTNYQLDTLKGMALYQMGELESAKRVFQNIYYSTADDNQRHDARDLYFAASPSLMSHSASTLFVDISTGYNSNVFVDGSSDTGTSAAITSAKVTYNQGPASVNLSVDEALGVPEAGFVRAGGQWTFLLKREKWSAVFIPESSLEMNESELYLARYGFGLGVETAGNRAVGIYVQVTRDLPLNTDSAYLLGVSAVEKFYWTVKRATSTFSAALVFQEDVGPDQILATGVLPLAGTSVGPALTGNWSFAPRWEVSGFSSYLFHIYNQPRFDQQFAIGTRFSYDLGRSTRATFSSQFVTNESTLGASSVEDRNYVQFISQAGITWGLL